MSLIYYDFETTGLNQFHDNITEYCFMRDNYTNEEKPTLTSLCNPEKPIPDIVTRITGIREDMVQNFPNFQNQSTSILEFLNLNATPTFFVAHNGDNFDFIILREQFKKSGFNIHSFPIYSIDTLLLAKKLYPNLQKHNLGFLCKTFNCYQTSAHRAQDDTMMLRSLYIHICGELAGIMGTDSQTVLGNPQLVYNYINGF